ncbi:hypothetical protein K3N28_12105 [Glycomyces sp. TRM65418]|uniref:hypothetical protein n=1 Tax=Glycomyces sp. TRM65418 TaxID=2867006 RepID=UPI001CE6CFA2|nr:hypothetical protein [Glycomyces sp. TRM65418]MCC3763809.1 hypothetical protein [Glycomyces sp. TRM65418]QZD53517.1 hypothetical protein K3N28_12040 [Glycomyces sp. TRM65418]
MPRITDTMLERAAEFIWLQGGALDQHRMALFLGDGDRDALRTALAAHRTADGGFAYAIEPDVKGPEPQPLSVMSALAVLDEADALDQAAAEPICDWLTRHTTPDGGVPDLLPSIAAYPRPPWVEPSPQDRGGLLTTARTTGLLLRHGIEHPWIDGATAFCRKAISALETTHPYEVFSIVAFLDSVSQDRGHNRHHDRDWAAAEAERIGALVRDTGLVLLDPANPDRLTPPPGYAIAEFSFPCDFAPSPQSLAAEWFTEEEMRAALDHLVSEQREDGGWPIHYRIWSPAIEQQARPGFTLAALRTLRAWDQSA